jgi:gliding motility-associated-like protein
MLSSASINNTSFSTSGLFCKLNLFQKKGRFLLLLMLTFGFNFLQAQTWQTPLQAGGNYLQSNLRGTYFLSASQGWAVGNSGTILTTNNGGTSWTAQTSGTTQSLLGVYFTSATQGWAVGTGGTILTTNNGGTSWTAQTSGTTQNLNSVYFTTASQGWAVGDGGTILTTSNSGASWTAQTSGTTQSLFGVYFTSATQGWAVGGGGTILATSNGGASWTAQPSGKTQSFSSVYFTSASQGWAVGDGGTILTTSNGGASWTAQTSGTTQSLFGVYFTSATQGWAVGTGGTILTTNNGGTSWTAQTSGTTQSLRSIYFTSATQGWAVGSGGTILTTSNGGASWIAQTFGTTQTLRGVYFTSATQGWAVGGGGTILTTSNGGASWTAQTSGTSATLLSVYFTSATQGWAVGLNGTILTTSNGGINWTAQTSGTTQSLFGVYFTSATQGWAVGTGGTILTTSNSGASWTAQTSGTTQALASVYFTSASQGWAVGGGGTILTTSNGGASWTAQTSGTTQTLNSVYFTSATQGWAVGTGGTILTTSNGGTSWTAQTSGTTQTLNSVYFTSATQGWSVGNNGTILITSNGGTSWTAQTSGTTASLFSVYSTSASQGWAVGNTGTILLFTSSASTPTISTTSTLTAFSNCAGTVSAEQSFTVSGSNLTNNITITVPTGYEVSTTSGSGFGSLVTLMQSGGNVASTSIYVRLASTATGTPSGNIVVASTDATSQNVVVSGTVNVLPTITLGSVSNVLTTATSFSLPYSATTGSPNQYSITTGTPTAMPSFSAVSNATLGSSPITVTIPASAANTYNFNATVRNSTTGCASSNTPFTVTVTAATPPPTTPATALDFDGVNDVAAGNAITINPTSFTVEARVRLKGYKTNAQYILANTSGISGFSLAINASTNQLIFLYSGGPITVFNYTVPLNQWILISIRHTNNNDSLFINGSFHSTVTTTSNPTTPTGVNARFAVGNTFVSGAQVPNTNFNGVVDEVRLWNSALPNAIISQRANCTPVSTETDLLACYTFNQGIGSGDNTTITSVTDITNNANSLSLLNIALTAGGSSNFITDAGSINSCNANSATITTTGSLTAFSSCAGTASTAQSLTVSGSNLTANITVTAPAGFEVSTNSNSGYSTSLNITQSGGTVANTTIFVRLASTATGTPSGNITITSTGATTQNVAVSGTVNALPTMTFAGGATPVVNVLRGSTTTNLSYTATTGNPNQYSVMWDVAGLNAGFSLVNNASLPSSNIPVPIPSTAPNGSYVGALTLLNTSTGCTSTLNGFGLVVLDSGITINGTVTAMNTCSGTPSTVRNFSVSGFMLTNDIVVTAPAGYEISRTNNSGFTSSITITQTNGRVLNTQIFVRLTGSGSGTVSGNITCSAAGSTTKNVAVSGTVNALPSIQLGSDGSVVTSGNSFNLPYLSTTANPDRYSITVGSVEVMSGFVPVVNAVLGTSPINVPIPSASPATYNFSIAVSNTTTGCSSSRGFTVTVIPANSITATGTLSAVNTTYGTASANTSFTVSATGLTNNLLVTAPIGYEVSTSVGSGFASSISIVPNSGTVASTTVFVRIPGTTVVGTYSGNIVCSSTGTPSQDIATVNSTVSPAALTITANNASKTYGSVANLSQFTATGLLNSDVVSTVNLSSAGTPATAAVGTYPITASSATGTGLSNYTITYNNGTLTVNPAALTITANNASKTYGAVASLSQFTATGLLNSDAVSAVNLSSTGTPATAAVGTYAITASNATGTGLANYTITYNNGTLTVNPAALNITANNASKTYGAVASLSQFTATGLLNSDVVSTVNLSSTGSPATAAVGTYPITASSATGTGLSNYTITYNNGTLTVNPAALTITANNASKTYGAVASLSQFTATGLLNSDAVSAVTLTSTGSPATAAVGTYPITASSATGTGLTNYTITYNNGTLIVNPAALTITANNASKTYGAVASLSQFTATGLLNSDAVSTVNLSSTGSPATAAVGTYPITASSATGTGLSNYTITYNNGTLTVNPAALTITANNASKNYGAVANLSQFTATGLLNSDVVSTVNLSSTGSVATAAVGTYPITASSATGTGLSNYTITYNNGTLTVNPAALTITANNASKTYGAVASLSQFTATGLLNSDAVSAVTLTSTGSPATAAVGTYPITAASATGTGLSNYTITYRNGTLTVNPAALTITASNANKFYGLTFNPTQFTASGLLNTDVVSAVTLTSSGTPATVNVGTYPITASSATGTGLSNYTITYNNGTLTVLPISLTITAANQTKCQGVAFNIPTDAWGVNGLVNADRVNTVNLFSAGAGIGATAGTYNIVPSGATGVGLSNYTITYINGTFTVNALPAVTASTSSSSVSRGRNVTLTATGSGSFAWSPAFGLSSPNTATTEARVVERTTYTVRLTGLNGCTNSASVTVDIVDDLFVEPSIIFTPNGDGINDRFVIKNIDVYPQNRLQVFDRAGRLLYEQNNYSNNWDGNISGRPLVKDTYFYVLSVKGRIVKRGSITLVR